jgi:FkbM family methyltransferase
MAIVGGRTLGVTTTLSTESVALRLLQRAVRTGLLRRGYSWILRVLPSPLWGGDPLVVSTRVGLMTLSPGERSSSSLICLGYLPHEQRESEIVAGLARNCRIVMDIGAHFGWYARLCLQANRSLVVHAFEPDPKTFEYLRANLATSRAKAVLAAVADYDGDITLWRGATSDLNSVVRAVGKPLTVRAITLDEYASVEGLSEIDFVKCDVEGAELQIVRGAAKLIGSARPPIWMLEVLTTFLGEAGFQYEELISRLREGCARGVVYAHSPKARMLRVVHSLDDLEASNVFFVPCSRRDQFSAAISAIKNSSATGGLWNE